MSPDDLTTALAHALMDYDAETTRGTGTAFTPDARAELLSAYRSIVERVILPRLWEAGWATWTVGRTSADFVTNPGGLTWCQGCGNYVHDQEAHMRWHERSGT